MSDDVTKALGIYNLLKDTFSGTTGLYTGKEYGNLEYLFKLHNIPEDLRLIYYKYIHLADLDTIQYYSKKAAIKTPKEADAKK